MALPLHTFALPDGSSQSGATAHSGTTDSSGSTLHMEGTAASGSSSASQASASQVSAPQTSPTRISSGLQPTESITTQERALALGPLPTAAGKRSTQHWPLFFDRLAQQGRAHCIDIDGQPTWIATERLPEAALLWPNFSPLQNAVISTERSERRDPRICICICICIYIGICLCPCPCL
jgi:hypothetical protein